MHRTYGIPEIVLIPYDIHNYPKFSDYKQMKTEFSALKPSVDHTYFIFRNECQTVGLNSVDVAMKMRNMFIQRYPNAVVCKSKQAPSLFKVLVSDTDNHWKYVDGDENKMLNAVSFIESYMPPPNQTSECAFETITFYNLLHKSVITGGSMKKVGGSMKRVGWSTKKVGGKTENKGTYKTMRKSHFVKWPKDISRRSIVHHYRRPIVDQPNFYYDEVNDLPIVALQ